MVLDRWTAGLAVCLYLFFLLFLVHESRFRIFRLRSFKGEKVFVGIRRDRTKKKQTLLIRFNIPNRALFLFRPGSDRNLVFA